MANKNFVVKNGLTVGTLEVIDSDGNISANTITGIINDIQLSGNTNITVLIVSGTSALGNVELSGDIIPTANVTYDLGSPERAFKDLYLSGNTINLGGIQLTDRNSALDVVTADDPTSNVKVSTTEGILINGNQVVDSVGKLNPDASGVGFTTSTVFPFPTGDYQGTDVFIGETTLEVDAFGVASSDVDVYNLMEPSGRITTTDLGDLS